MANKDLYVELCKFYEFMLGEIPNKEVFISALKETVTEDDLRVLFLMPFSGVILHKDLLKKAAKLGINESQIKDAVLRMAAKGYVLTYETKEGRAYERGNPVFMTEQQVRGQEETKARSIFANFMDSMIGADSVSNPNKTPYYRVLPVEYTLTGKIPAGAIKLDAPVPDQRQVLPIDVVTEMVNAQEVVGVAECFCRKARTVVGKACEHPLETCFVFNEFAEGLIEVGLARQLTKPEALEILRHCEEVGLVHNADNAEGHLRTLCNCCSCSCVIMNAIHHGSTSSGAPSRFVVSHDVSKCITCGDCVEICPANCRQIENGKMVVDSAKCLGCGLCVTKCKQSANHMDSRQKYPKIYPTHKALWGQIGKESVIGILKSKVFGK
jgi:Pyruvate/2-oxoacid:ferredoxin oxidoreductase delta subunit